MSKNKISLRHEIPKSYQWNVEALYHSDALWNNELDQLDSEILKISSFIGKVGLSSENLFATLSLNDLISQKLERLYVYAKMKKDENNTNETYIKLFNKAQSAAVEIQMQLSFVIPEITAIAENRLLAFIAENNNLATYEFMLKELLRQESHILSKESEKLIAQFGEISSAPENIFRMINNADMKFPIIKDENNEDIEITHGRYIKLLESSNREVRKNAFTSLYQTYKNQQHTLATTLNFSVKNDVLHSKLRSYPSSLEASLDEDFIDTNVYTRLIETVHQNMDIMHQYIDLRKKLLNVNTLHMYDIYTPMVPKIDDHVPYEKAKTILLEALAPLGTEYIDILKQGFDDQWVDVYENSGKTSGAYSFGAYDSAPYVLMNYQNTINDVFTLAHEMGHSMHSYYTRNNQPYTYGDYKIFVAEVASTVNEALLMDYMLKHSNSKAEKLYLLNHFLEQFRGTLYRQTMFAEFEKWTHEMIEKGESLTADSLCEKYYDLNKLYYGETMIIDEEIKMEWSRIPHFYSAFYVYKYATGYSAAIALSQKLINKEKNAQSNYLDFLKSGSSDHPTNLLKLAGVDMTTPQPIQNALMVFKKLVDEVEYLV